MDSKDPDSNELYHNFADMVVALRKGLDSRGHKDKTIGYTTRYNAAWNANNIPSGFAHYENDGEAKMINSYIKKHYNETFADQVSYVNIELYDAKPADLDGPDTGPI